MSMEKLEPISNNVLLVLQICLGIWQFMKLTPVGAMIRGLMGWLLRPFRLSPTYARLQHCDGRVFKRLNCYVLQPDIPSERTGIHRVGHNTNSLESKGIERDMIELKYLGEEFVLQRRGKQRNFLFILQRTGTETNKDGKMYSYITPTIWEELHTLEEVLNHGRIAAADAAAAAAATDHADYVSAVLRATASVAAAAAAAADRAAAAAAADDRTAAAVAADRAAAADRVFVTGLRGFWEDVITGGVMTLTEVLDEIIVYNQHVSLLLSDDWLLPVNLSVSEEKLLKIINLFALFLQTKKEYVHWLLPTSMSFIAAVLEFSTGVRVLLYTQINVVFCTVVHFICDRLPRSWRRQLYSLGKWVDNLKPGNDIQLKIQRGNILAIIAGSAKVDKDGAILVDVWDVFDAGGPVIREQFRCDPVHSNISCAYVKHHQVCQISAPTISVFYVTCKSVDDFKKIVTLVECIARNGCGSLISYGPNHKVRVRGFRESITSYVKSGLPSVYELGLDNVIVG